MEQLIKVNIFVRTKDKKSLKKIQSGYIPIYFQGSKPLPKEEKKRSYSDFSEPKETLSPSGIIQSKFNII